MPNVWEGLPTPMRPVSPEEADLLRRRDALLNKDEILNRRDAMLNRPMPAPATNAGPADEQSPGGNQFAAQISRLDQQIAAIERDMSLRAQARDRLVAEKQALVKAASGKK